MTLDYNNKSWGQFLKQQNIKMEENWEFVLEQRRNIRAPSFC